MPEIRNPPTVFDGVGSKMLIAQEEIFGPVLSVLPFSDEDAETTVADAKGILLSAC